MEVIILENQQAASELASKRILSLVTQTPNCVLGFATGSTPLKTYELLGEAKSQQNIDFSKITSFNLDEYVGLPTDHASSYSYYMHQHVFGPLGLSPEQYHLPNGMAANIELECQQYEQKIKERGPIDLQILGIGRDGHIGFNEPGSSLGSRTRLKTLTETTRGDNKAHFQDQRVPYHVVTMGIQSIMEASEILLLAFGDAKADAIAKTVEGPITASVPASALQYHPKVKIFLDLAAASKLQNLEYYQEVYRKKPAWQLAEFI